MLERGNLLIAACKVWRRKSRNAFIADICNCMYFHLHDGDKGIMTIELPIWVDVVIPVANVLHIIYYVWMSTL